MDNLVDLTSKVLYLNWVYFKLRCELNCIELGSRHSENG